jgi:uncharacterized protein YjbJ (UPF0337 family)
VERTGAAALNPAKGATVMKPSTKNKVQGKFHEMKGKVRAKAGQLTNNPGLQAEGIVEEAAGQGSRDARPGGEVPWKNSDAGSSPTVLNGNIGHSGQ